MRSRADTEPHASTVPEWRARARAGQNAGVEPNLDKGLRLGSWAQEAPPDGQLTLASSDATSPGLGGGYWF
jgi:hypothetical protein